MFTDSGWHVAALQEKEIQIKGALHRHSWRLSLATNALARSITAYKENLMIDMVNAYKNIPLATLTLTAPKNF